MQCGWMPVMSPLGSRPAVASACRPRRPMVESRCGAVALGRTYLLPPLSSGGAFVVQPWLRFHIPLIEPDMQISRIRLGHDVPVEVREWIGPALASPDLVLDAQPPAQPHSGVIVDRPVRLVDGANTEVVGPSA